MAAHRRRKTPAAAFRIALILGANAVLIWFLWGLVRAPARAQAAPVAEVPASPANVTSATAPVRPAAPHSSARLDALGAQIRGIVGRAKGRAVALGKGKIAADSLHVSVHLRDPETGAEFGLDSARAMRPASNMKLVTTASALCLLGSGWHFTTPIEARGVLKDGELDGDLVLHACGDPLFDPSGDGDVERLLAPALDELGRAGLRSVSGNLVLDEGTFDPPAPPQGWPGPDQRYLEYCALSGGFSVNRGCLTVRVSPGAVGLSARIEVAPEGYGLERRFSATTSAGGKVEIGIDARPTGVIVRGTLPKSSAPFVASCPVPDPVLLFGNVFESALERRGIKVAGKLVRERGSAPGRLLATIRTPLASYLAPINQESINGVADQLYLATANAFLGNAARAAAPNATLAALERLGVSGEGFRQLDGSGLSELNRVSARQLSALLEAMTHQDEQTARTYRASLAVAGVSGTLDDRMHGRPAAGRITAKTGFIDGTSALSGFAEPKSGGEIVFSILVNYDDVAGLNLSVWKPMENEICELLVGAAP